MKISMTSSQLIAYVARQVELSFPDSEVNPNDLKPYVLAALERTEYCFSHIKVKSFFDGKQTLFNHLHSDQYAIFLYYLANTIWCMNGDIQLASKIYYLNKSLHSLDIFYEVQLPDIFCLVHPVGTVLGRADYSNYFVAYQRCTVGGNLAYEYPNFEEGVALFGGSALIGNCHIQRNSWIAAGSLLMDIVVPANHIAFGQHPAVKFKPTRKTVIERFFR